MVSVTIDIGALRNNLEVLRRLAPKSRVMAVIKANAYGHGLIAVARALESADALAVARLGEALNLREAGVKTPVVLLEGVLDREQLEAAAAPISSSSCTQRNNWSCSKALRQALASRYGSSWIAA